MNAKEKEISSKIGHSVDQGGQAAAGQDSSSRGQAGAPDGNEREGTGTGNSEGGVIAAAAGVLESVKSAVGLGRDAQTAGTGESKSMV